MTTDSYDIEAAARAIKTERRIAKTNAMLAALSAAPNYAEYMTAFVALEKRLHGLPGMGWQEANRAWAEFARIQTAQRACMFTGKPATLDDVTSHILRSVEASTRMEAAE